MTGEKILQLLKNEDGGKDESWKLEEKTEYIISVSISIEADFSPLII
ncbi:MULTISPECIES: hypothetical protein [unclassified Chryseobacterium]|nr:MULTISPECIES: hypothetical protein [unclassified Chryseobacterium]